MPYYQYRTEDGDVIEVQQAITDDPLTEWEGKPVVKVYSAPGIVLKGRGFYRTGG